LTQRGLFRIYSSSITWNEGIAKRQLVMLLKGVFADAPLFNITDEETSVFSLSTGLREDVR